MHASPYPLLVVSRLLLIVAILLGQFSGGGVCCCWLRYCVGQFASSANERPTIRTEIKKPACPKCLARLKKSQGTRVQIDGNRCPCSSHAWQAISNEFESDSRILLDGGEPTCTLAWSWQMGALSNATRPPECIRVIDWGRWQARACIWRI
jgi:hypothetical protein